MKPAIAIVERLPGHTEVMGVFAALALEIGYDPHLLFNRTDEFHMVDYLRERFALPADHIHDWTTINDPQFNFAALVLNSSVVWLDYQRQLQNWRLTKKIIAVHHHPDDIQLNPYGGSIYLTPVGGHDKWIFPLYQRPNLASKISFACDAPRNLPELTIVGSLQSKDAAGVADYLKIGGKVVHYDRHNCDYYVAWPDLYTLRRGFDGNRLISALAQHQRPLFLWMPIPLESTYTSNRFTGALIFGVDLDCVMVMPERLRQLYDFPESSVITYNASVAEPDTLEKLRGSASEQSERRKQLLQWAATRWDNNLAVFRAMLA